MPQTCIIGLLLLSGLAGFHAEAASAPLVGGDIELKTDSLVYVIGEDGLNHSFRDRLGREYLQTHSSFMSIEKDGRKIGSTSVRMLPASRPETLHVKFGESGIEADVRVGILPEFLTFELVSISDHSVSLVQLANLPLTLTKYVSQTIATVRDDQYAAAIVPLNIETHSSAAKSVLTAYADRRVRLEGARFALIACPTNRLLSRLERIELKFGLPHPTLGGVWARNSPEQEKSYLFCDLAESTADEMIAYAKAGGFGSLVIYSGVWNATNGTYAVNRENFPNGDAGLKEVSRKIHAAGLKFGMHNLDMVVSKTDPLVRTAAASGFMMYPERRRTLAQSVGTAETFIPTTTSPAGLLAKGDKSRLQGRDLRIGAEIVTYKDLQTSPPFGFSGCERGAHGTKAVSHPAASSIENFTEFVGFYRPDIKGELYDVVARAEASALDKFGFDYIYPDGTGENLGDWPDQPEWYIYNLQISKLFRYTKREVMWAHAPITDYSWHIFSRGNTTDFVQTGVIEHFDRVSVAGARDSFAELQPFEFGWFGYFTNALDVQATRPREMEYAWSKALAYRAAMSLETNKDSLDHNGRTGEILAGIKHWEELKLSGYFPEHIREQLKTPGAEFQLEKARNGQWDIVPVQYSPEKYVGDKDRWVFENPGAEQPLQLTIDAMPSVARFGDQSNVELLGPEKQLNLNTSGKGPLGSPSRHTEGLSFALKAEADMFEASAVNKGSNTAGWGCAEIVLDGPADLREHRALGAWVEGDGSGAYLHFVMEDSGRWSVRDYYVHLDFKGRRYIEMREPAKGEVYDFKFPFSNYWAIRNIDFKTISRVYVFLTGVPAGASVGARFSRVEALRETPLEVENASLTVNGEPVAFPYRLETGWYLEYAAGKARVFDANGFEQTAGTPVGPGPALRKGSNQIGFECPGCGSARVAIITHGQPLRR